MKDKKDLNYNLPVEEKNSTNESIEITGFRILEDLLDKNLNVKIKTQADLFDFINKPEKYITDEETIQEIKRLKDLVVGLRDFDDK